MAGALADGACVHDSNPILPCDHSKVLKFSRTPSLLCNVRRVDKLISQALFNSEPTWYDDLILQSMGIEFDFPLTDLHGDCAVVLSLQGKGKHVDTLF